MANEQNLKPFDQLTESEQRAIRSKGGKASGEARRARKTLREELLALLSQEIKDENGNSVNTQVAMSTSLIKEAIDGNTKAFELVRDTIGEKPVDKVEQVNIDMEYKDSVNYVERCLLERSTDKED
jgi:TRAP-type C4-dicarboxylate transport system substrate-binding protein